MEENTSENTLNNLSFVVNFCWSELDTVSGSIREWICCTLDIVCIWIQCMIIKEIFKE